MTAQPPMAPRLVQRQLAGKHVLIAGTTGFLGKVVLEKLLRELPPIAGVYLLTSA